MARLSPLPFWEIKRRLEASGFAEMGQTVSQVKFAQHEANLTDIVIVPQEREVPVGVVLSILNQAHIHVQQRDAL